MTIKPMNQKTFDELIRLSDNKLDRRIEWLNHTGYAEAIEDGGRLFYNVKVTIGRNMAKVKRFSTRINSNGNKVLDIIF